MLRSKLISVLAFACMASSIHAGGFGDLLKNVNKTDTKASKATAPDKPKAPGNILSFKVESTRIIGDKLLISGKASVTKKTTARITFYPKGITSGGTLEAGRLDWAGEIKSLASGPSFDLEEGIPVAWHIYLETNGQKVTEINQLKIFWKEDRQGTTVPTDTTIESLKIPSAPDTNLTPGSEEIDRGVYLRLTKAQSAKGILKIGFVLDNRSGKAYKLDMHSIGIVDDQGNEVADPAFFAGNKNMAYESPELAPDVPLAGRFEFKTNAKPAAVKLLRFAVKDFRGGVISHAIRDPQFQK